MSLFKISFALIACGGATFAFISLKRTPLWIRVVSLLLAIVAAVEVLPILPSGVDALNVAINKIVALYPDWKDKIAAIQETYEPPETVVKKFRENARVNDLSFSNADLEYIALMSGVNGCRKGCSFVAKDVRERVTIEPISFQIGLYSAFIVTRDDRAWCGSSGCPDYIMVRDQGTMIVLSEGRATTMTEAERFIKRTFGPTARPIY